MSSRKLAAGGLLVVLAAATWGCGSPAEETASLAEPHEGVLQVVGTDQLAFEPAELTGEAGEITIELTSEEGVEHDLVIDETDERVVTASAGETDVGTVSLESGTYTFFCSIPGHRTAGMEGSLDVAG